MRPDRNEYAPFHETYISLVQAEDITAAVEQQGKEMVALLSGLGEKMGDYRYAPDKWSIKEVLGHIIDGERVLSYRALCIARGEKAPLPGYEQDDYVKYGGFESRTLASLIEEF